MVVDLSRTLLIDADIIAYACSASNEQRIDWNGDGVISVAADLRAAKIAARDTIDHLVAKLDGTAVIVCLSDDLNNFRKDVSPTYKSHRTSVQRPEHLYDIKEWLGQKYPTEVRHRLEADDVMGILATEPHAGERIMVSEDKDMMTVPALLYRPHKPGEGVRLISVEEAERFHLWQTIVGDQTDGYPGCPGQGPDAAERLLAGIGYASHVHTFLRGPRKGEEEVRWEKADLGCRWAAIVSAYEKCGQSEAHAVIQANLARILKHGDVDGNRVIPWVPPVDLKGAN